jgi:branched-chain amino acid transport system substrate-binding protein
MAVGCGNATTPTTPSASGTPFNVLAVLGVSGSNGPTGLACVNGAQAAALVLNQQGGISGHKVVVKAYDSQSNPTQAVSLVSQALGSGTAWNFAFSGQSSDENLAENPTLNKAKIISITQASAAALNNTSTFPYHFGSGSDAILSTKFLVDYAQKQGYKKVGVLAEDIAYTQTAGQDIVLHLKEAGIPYVFQTFAATAVDVSPALLQLKDSGVDAVLWSALGTSIGYVAKSRTKIGWTIPFVGDLGVSAADTYTVAGADNLTNIVYQQWAVDLYKDPSKRTKQEADFYDAYHSVAITVTQPLAQAGACYDVMTVMKYAVQQAGSLDPDKLKAALESLKIPHGELLTAPSGFGWTATNHFPANTPDQFVYIKPGPLVDGQIKG